MAKAIVSGSIAKGWKRNPNGAVRRRVLSGSVTETRSRNPSRGLARRASGSLPSGLVSNPSGRRCSETRVRTLSALTVRPVRCETTCATAASSRLPSTASSTA